VVRLLIALEQPVTGVAIAREVGVTQPRVSQVLAQLSDKGLSQLPPGLYRRPLLGHSLSGCQTTPRRATVLLVQHPATHGSGTPGPRYRKVLAGADRLLR
jgi:hypothetical protein